MCDLNQGNEAVGQQAPNVCRTAIIRRLNDRLRTEFLGGQVMVTPGVMVLPDFQRRALLRAIRAFEAFDSDNDPHGEHDFGSVDQDGQRFFWKVDYYDADMLAGSPDPADPNVTRRVLTIMLAEEY